MAKIAKEEFPDYLQYGKRLGGFFEISGSMWLSEDTDSRRPHLNPRIIPWMSYGDTDESVLETLKDTLGGSIGSSKTRSRKWSIKNERAILIAEAVAGFAPSKLSLLEAFSRLGQLSNYEDKSRIFQQYEKGVIPRHIKLPIDSYIDLIVDDEFVSGLIDGGYGRSYTRDYSAYSVRIHELTFLTSEKKGLLDAVADRFGGSVEQTYWVGEEVVIQGRKSIVTEDCFMWVGREASTRKILRAAEPGLLLRRGEVKETLDKLAS